MADELADLQARIAQDRARMAAAAQDLRNSLTPSGLLRQGMDQVADSPVGQLVGVAADALGSGSRIKALGVAGGLGAAALALLRLGPGTGTGSSGKASADWQAQARTAELRAAGLMVEIDEAERHARLSPDEIARARATVQAALASDMDKALSAGLAQLPEAERQAAITAREGERLQRLLEQGGISTDAVQGLAARHPLLVGAMAVGAGAGLAWLLPRQDAEEGVARLARDGLGAGLRQMSGGNVVLDLLARLLGGAVADRPPVPPVPDDATGPEIGAGGTRV